VSDHKTHTALARALNVSSTAIRNWQRDFDDAPKTWTEAEWRDFIDRHGLGQAGPRKSRRREELLVEKLASEVRLNQIKIQQAEAKLIPAEDVDNYLLFLAARVKSAMYQGFTTELPPKVAGLDVSDIRRLAREHADLVCVSMQNALEDWKTEQNARRKAAAQEAKSA
jgi:hypothetical protein